MKITPFHLAAERGDFQVCQEIMENSHDKNPKSINGWTPLHLAAKNGHLLVCQLIVENIDDKNPKNQWGQTPSQLTRNPEIKKLIENAIKRKITL